MSNTATPTITVERETRPVIVLMNDNIIASTKEALILKEGNRAPVYYIPKEHVAMEFLLPTDHHTTCPHKGEARYWTITGQGRAVENGAWAYDNPHEAASAIAGHLSFYPDKLRIEVG